MEDEKKESKPGAGGKHHGNTQQKDASKFSFAFKSKPPPVSPAKPPPDLNSKFKDSSRPEHDEAKIRQPPTHPKQRHDQRNDRKDDRRDNRRDDRRDDRRNDYRDDRRPRDDRGPDYRQDRRPIRSRSPPRRPQKVVKPKPTLPPEMEASDSIYYRKPGNESVIGAGTYGKVFKAIHIYTKDEVALKKIRMEGERDGFPITAVREIRQANSPHHSR